MTHPDRRLLALAFAVSLLAATFAAPRPARADGDDAEARATKLFEEGRTLARAGRCPEAIELFQASLKEATGVGSLLNLGDCYERMGKPATARGWFVRAQDVARERSDPRATEAAERARALEPKISDLTVRIADPEEAGLAIALDGEPLDRARWNVAVPVDPGAHAVEATSLRRGKTSLRVVVPDGARHVDVVVPAPLPASPSTASPPSATRSTEPPPARIGAAPEAPREPHDGSLFRTLGWAAGGLGAGAVAAGSVFGVLSIVNHGSVLDRCPDYPTCPAASRSAVDDANSSAHAEGTVATVSIAAGVALVAAGVVLVLTAPRGP
jgi:hypothetical protein